ncbi:hypothetical protein C8Q80DRAFT_680218 [Daedaleopsis nitida]|nr:hypothetical protein C8Q80DRAFT_680218 [Daedaleopsis nitida]
MTLSLSWQKHQHSLPITLPYSLSPVLAKLALPWTSPVWSQAASELARSLSATDPTARSNASERTRAAYTCPNRFSPPPYATIMLAIISCDGHVYTAAQTIRGGVYALLDIERIVARWPLCRAPIPGRDGKGEGLLGCDPTQCSDCRLRPCSES